MSISFEEFEDLVAEAMDAIPEPFAAALDEVAVVVQERAAGRSLYGLYHGIPRTAGELPSGALPAQITVYIHPLVDHFPDRAALVEQVRVTVLHELGHHLGFGEERLEELGYG